ncbi:MAG: PAS domain-containing sensor histidine kinase [Chloroflexi bacterium]|nr:MAG: PAS domain-containing sensor histidine kinase [Chloroflexota bacterium]
MMTPSAPTLILKDRRVAYALTDHSLTVQEVGGVTEIFPVNGTEELVGRPLRELAPELVGSETALEEVLTGVLPRFQLSWVNRETPAGETTYVTLVNLPFRDQTGQITGLLHLTEDVTEIAELDQRLVQQRNELRLLRDRLNRQNEALAAANAELRRLDEVKSVFVSIAAHELRSPLASMLGFIEILLDQQVGPLNEKQQEYLQIVQQGAERLLHTTDMLLDVTRIEAGRISLVLQPANLPEIVSRLVQEFSPQAGAKQQRLVWNPPPSLPLALCDAEKTAQIITNLLSNAIKYTPSGGQITLSLSPAEEEGYLQLAVSDTGVGMSPEDQARLFTRFFRGDSANKTGAGGTGLGLYITRSLVELQGGTIRAESEPDKGSTFYVTFPVADAPAPLNS